MISSPRALALTVALCFAPMTAQAMMADDVNITNAMISTLPPVAKTGAIYAEIENTSDNSVQIIGAATNISEKTELHTMEMTDGIMRMKELKEGITLAPHETHSFSRGHDHFMLMGLQTTPQKAKNVTLTLVFKDESQKTIDVKVVDFKTK